MNKFVLVLLSALILGACGGGGSSTTAPPAPTLGEISEANLFDVSGVSYDSATLLTAMTTISSATGVQSQAGRNSFDLKSLIKLQVMEALQVKVLPETVAGVVNTVVQNCSVSGNATVTLDDADNSASLTTGDKLKLVFNNCVTNPGNGSNFTRNGTTLADFVKRTPTEDTLAIVYQGLVITLPASATTSAATVNMNGNLTSSTMYAIGVTTETITVPSLTLASASEALSYTNYQISESVNTTTGAYTKSGLGTFGATGLGSFNLSTPVAFQGNRDEYPSVGKLKIVGATSTAYLTAIDTFSAKLELDKGSDSTIDVTKTAAWGTF
jgi:hypothetical protein